jgi:hypothetical protein
MTEVEAMDILETISAAYPHFDLTGSVGEKRISLWLTKLEKMPYTGVKKRLEEHLGKSHFPPSIAEISVSPPSRNQYLEQHRQWVQEGQQRIAHEKRQGITKPKPPWEE